MACAPRCRAGGPAVDRRRDVLQCWSFLGVPAITVKGGLSPEGLPLGLQLVAPQGEDYALMRVGAWSENVLGLLPPPAIA